MKILSIMMNNNYHLIIYYSYYKMSYISPLYSLIILVQYSEYTTITYIYL